MLLNHHSQEKLRKSQSKRVNISKTEALTINVLEKKHLKIFGSQQNMNQN